MNPDHSGNGNLSFNSGTHKESVLVVGEVLWDLFEHSRRLGGAPLNFGVHAQRLGHAVTLISAVGADELGEQAAAMIADLNLDQRFVQTTAQYPTGTARVEVGSGGSIQFTIPRPAAYDAIELSNAEIEQLRLHAAGWFYYGTLFASTLGGKRILDQLLSVVRDAKKFYDVNLRPGSDSLELVRELLAQADVVKLNEDELRRVHRFVGLPSDAEAFCRKGSTRFGWEAVGLTLGDRGCAILANGEYVEAEGHAVDVVDTVGAGDAFAAAFMHGLSLCWPTAEIASFANRVGALVASRHGAIPDWTLEEAVRL